ncbi:MAG: helix-turn-helix domain-containing protein [bacterium]
MLTTKEIAKLLGIKVARVNQVLQSGKMKGQKMGYDWFVKLEEVEKYRRDRVKSLDKRIAHNRRTNKIQELVNKGKSYDEIANILNNLGKSYDYFDNEWWDESVKVFYSVNKNHKQKES